MKKNLLLITLACGSLFAFAQSSNEKPNFHDQQQSFNEKWAPYDVQGGKYLKDGKLVKASGWKQFKRYEWYWEKRVGPSGEFPKNSVVWDEWKKMEQAKGQRSASRSASWSIVGPTTSTCDATMSGIGRVNCIAFHPTNNNTMWVGTPSGGLWKTTDGGSTWSTNTDNLPVLGVSSIAINESDPSIMYIATGDGDGGSFSVYGRVGYHGDTKSVGILKSSDGGNTWNETGLAVQVVDNVYIKKILISPADVDILYAATNDGIWISTDAGVTWDQYLLGNFYDIEFHPTDPSIVYASSFDWSGDAQIYKSIDYGDNWSQVTNLSGVIRIEIAVTKASEDLVELLCVADDNSLHSMVYSTDQGQNWSAYVDGSQAGYNYLAWQDDASDAGGQGNYDLAFAIDPNNADNYIIGGVNNWRSNDAGSNWTIATNWIEYDGTYNTNANTPIMHSDQHYIAYHPTKQNELYVCNDGGVFKSTDNGNSWSNITNNIVISQPYSIDNSENDPQQIAAGLQDNSSILKLNGTWTKTRGGDGMITRIDDKNGVLYASYAQGVIDRIDDVNNINSSRVYISDNIPGGPKEGSWVTPLELDPNNTSTIYIGYDELFKSTDMGDSFTSISNFGSDNIEYIAISHSNSDHLVVGWPSALKLTKDGGSSWTDITGTLPVSNAYISSVLFGSGEELYVTFSGYEQNYKVYFSNNEGISWQNMTSSGLPNLPVNCIEYDIVNDQEYVGTDMGVYYYENNQWSQYGTGLPNVNIADLDIQYSTNTLRAGTFGRGIWEADAVGTGIADKISRSKVNIYPNPSKGEFVLELENWNSSKQTMVTVFDYLGQVVSSSSLQGITTAFNIADNKPGMYIIRIQMDEEIIHLPIIKN